MREPVSRDGTGQGLAEFGLIVALVALASSARLSFLAPISRPSSRTSAMSYPRDGSLHGMHRDDTGRKVVRE